MLGLRPPSAELPPLSVLLGDFNGQQSEEDEESRYTLVDYLMIIMMAWGCYAALSSASTLVWRMCGGRTPVIAPAAIASVSRGTQVPDVSGLAYTPFRAGESSPFRCDCGLRIVPRISRRTNENYGRRYLACPMAFVDETRCSYFRWM